MASGPLVGSGGDGSREKHRWNESKVYTRKTHNKGSKPPPFSQTLAAAAAAPNDADSSQQQTSRFDAASDDSSSLNRRQVSASTLANSREPASNNGAVARTTFPPLENRVTISLPTQSKQEIRELRRKLTNELDQVRNLVKKLESREIQFTGYSGGGYSHSQFSSNDGMDNGGRRANLEAIPRVPPEPRPLHQLSVSVVENSQGGMSDIVEKEKRTPKVNQYYRSSDFVLGKEKFPLLENNKKLKLNGSKKHGGDGDYVVVMDKHTREAFKQCGNLLSKLMKHKHGWVFNTPVDVKELGLHDYYSIIKHPMDLGTVKWRLSKNWYKSPREFAEDVRLTFRNAMTYNPKGQDVHIMADQLLQIFEERWEKLEAEYNLNLRFEMDKDLSLPTPTSALRKVPLPELRTILDRSESTTLPHDSQLKSTSYTPSGRIAAPKKPKAKDPNKRDMTYDEKQRLSAHLLNLPSEKLDNIVQIIKKRNSTLSQHDDEIEVDIDSFDAETLWELDRFVTNYKKSLSKNKRKAELAIQARGETGQNVQIGNTVTVAAEAPKESKTDEKNISSSSPVEGEKHGDNASRSSSSSSSSSDSGSSSSDSDSDSSSAASDAAHSPRS